MQEFLNNNQWIYNIIYSLSVIIVALVVYLVIAKIIMKKIKTRKYRILLSRNSSTYVNLFKSINRYLFIIVVILVLLKINGVNITTMITGVGIFGIIFGFAIQDALKDVIKGFDIITDSYYRVGDVVRIDNYTGVVTAIGIKTTKLEDIYEKNIISISNRNIEKVEVLSHMINIDIPMPYDLKLKRAEEVINYIKDNIRKIDKVEDIEYRGVNEFDESSIKYQIKVYCPPTEKTQIRRDALTCILKCLEENGIEIPFKQIDIHQK